jgi:hypothetical protein
MKDYIEDWLKQSLLKKTEEGQLEEVETEHETKTRDNIKGTSRRK